MSPSVSGTNLDQSDWSDRDIDFAWGQKISGGTLEPPKAG